MNQPDSDKYADDMPDPRSTSPETNLAADAGRGQRISLGACYLADLAQPRGFNRCSNLDDWLAAKEGIA